MTTLVILLTTVSSIAFADVLPPEHSIPSPTPAARTNSKFDSVQGWGPLTFSMTLDEARAALKKAKIDASGNATELQFKAADGFVTVTSRQDGNRTLVRRISITAEPHSNQMSAKAWAALLPALKERYGTPGEAENFEHVYVWENKNAKLELLVYKRHDFFTVKQTWSRPGDEARDEN